MEIRAAAVIGIVILIGAAMLGVASIISIWLSRGRLKGYGLGISAIAIAIVSWIGLAVAYEAAREPWGMPWESGAKITGAHLFAVSFARETDRAGRPRGLKLTPEPTPREVMACLQERDTIGDAVRKACGRRPHPDAVLEVMASMQARYFSEPGRVKVGERFLEFPAHTAVFFVVDREPHQGIGAATPIGWSMVEEATKTWSSRNYLRVTGTQVLSARSPDEFQFETKAVTR
ncbi:MAG TPA: hypothetical protein VJU16_09385 [Planctomycetota bacterium]|nr:hypothetical protein [Planctomycetota bacterium]